MSSKKRELNVSEWHKREVITVGNIKGNLLNHKKILIVIGLLLPTLCSFAQNDNDALLKNGRELLGKELWYNIPYFVFPKNEFGATPPLLSKLKVIDVTYSPEENGLPLRFYFQFKNGKRTDTVYAEGSMETFFFHTGSPEHNVFLPITSYIGESNWGKEWNAFTRRCYADGGIHNGMQEKALRVFFLSPLTRHDEKDDYETEDSKIYIFQYLRSDYTVTCRNGKVTSWIKH